MPPVEWPVTYRRKVRFSDSDSQGIVFNGHYLTYWDDAMTDYLEALGDMWERMRESGCELVLRRVEIDFRSPGRIGDTLVTGVRAGMVGNRSLTFRLRTWDDSTGRVVAEGVEVQVMVDAHTFEPVPVPGFLVTAIELLEEREVERKGDADEA